MAILPSGYTQLEYIESTGTQYIDTGYNVTNNTKVEMDCRIYTAPSNQIFLFGVTNSTTGNAGRYGVTYINGNWRNVTADNQYDFPSSTAIGRHIIIKEGNSCSIDGVNGNTTSGTIFTSNKTLPLFCRNQGGTLNAFASMLLYSCSVTEKNDIIFNFIPCKSSLNEIGLYDIVNNQFYPNVGTGTFIAGPELAKPNMYVKIDNAWQPVTSIYTKTNNTW